MTSVFSRFSFVLSFVAASLMLTAWSARAGDLAPSPGPVAPTMKNLPDVEPRTVLRNDFDSLTPIVISSPGSYYLGEDIAAFPNQHGIRITADNVTLDLNGFSIIGNTEVGSLDGVRLDPGADNATILNGTIQLFFGIGVNGATCTNMRVEDVRVLSCGGVGLRTGAGSSVRNCIASSNGGGGFRLGLRSHISGSTATANTGDGIELNSSCHATGNVSDGNTLNGIFISDSSNIVTGNICSGNSANGIYSDTLNRGNRIDSNNTTYNLQTGIRVEGSDNLVTRNLSIGNSVAHYNIDPANAAGAISTNPATAGAWANIQG